MILEKGRARPVETPDPMDSLEGMLQRLAEIEADVKREKKAYLEKTKDNRESIKSMKAVITEEVIKLGKTVTVGNVRAEYVPQVVIKMKKEKNDEA